MCFFRKRKERKRVEQLRQEQLAKEQQFKLDEKELSQVEEVASETKKSVTAKKPVAVKKPAATKKPAVKNDIRSYEVSEKPKSETTKYHVSQNKDSKSEHFKKWRVRKEGSQKTIKFFDTQKQAIEFAQELSEDKKATVVVHRVDGTIRKI